VTYFLAVLAIMLSIVAFRRYVIGYGTRSFFVAVATIVAGGSPPGFQPLVGAQLARYAGSDSAAQEKLRGRFRHRVCEGLAALQDG
jgi:hypothetical protein